MNTYTLYTRLQAKKQSKQKTNSCYINGRNLDLEYLNTVYANIQIVMCQGSKDSTILFTNIHVSKVIYSNIHTLSIVVQENST